MARGVRSRHHAEAEVKNVDSTRLAATITQFIEWRAFAYWIRLIVEAEGHISPEIQALLESRCPGFIGALTVYRESHHREREFVWLRLIEWIDDNVFDYARTEGWRHALGYY